MSQPSSSYGQILKSSSIIGGAQGVNYLIALLRTKAVALLLGPSGVGLVSLFASATELVGTVAGLGIGSSGVRAIAEAHSKGNKEELARTIKSLQRACWITGLMGWLLSAALSYPLSIWAFGSTDRAWAIAILGVTIVFTSVAGGRSAILQGTRRIGDFARMGISGALAATICALILYGWLGERGILPVLIATALVNFGLACFFARKVEVSRVTLTWGQTLTRCKELTSLGFAFMYGAVLAALVGLAIRAIILRQFGADSNGIYQAAWAFSGMFAAFILNAMGTDFYPRLTAVAVDNKQVNRLVNEQIEIGLLLALPGLLAALALAPWLMKLFYSAKFLPSADLLPWLMLGIFGQVITFPIGYIQRAKGRAGWIIISQTHINVLHFILFNLSLLYGGLVGAATAFFLATYIHGILTYFIARRIAGFHLNQTSLRLIISTAAVVSIGAAAQCSPNATTRIAVGLATLLLATLVSLRGIASRLGSQHKIVKAALKMPGGRIACGL